MTDTVVLPRALSADARHELSTRRTSSQSATIDAKPRQATVVVGYDEEPAGLAALEWAAAEAELRGARLRVIHQMVGSEVPDRYGFGHAAEVIGIGTSRINTAVRRLVGPVKQLEVVVTTEPIADELLHESVNADLLVVGATYAHPSGAVIFDAVSRFLAHYSRCPLLLVPAGHTSSAVAELVCGVDRSAGSSHAVRWAAREAALRGVTVLADEVRPPVGGHRAEPDEPLSHWVRHQRVAEPTTIICRVATERSAARHLLDTAAERSAILVVGAHARKMRLPHRCLVGLVTAQDRVPVVVVPTGLPQQR